MLNRLSSPFFWVLVSGGLCTSCAVTAPQEINAKYAEVLTQRRDGYRIKDGDLVTVRIYNRPSDLSRQDLIVLPDGRSDAFFMPDYRFAGKTVPQVQADVERFLETEVNNPEVSIQVTPRGEVVYLNGEFEMLRVVGRREQTSVELTTSMSLHDAIAAVGGVRVTGDSDYALLRRTFGNESGHSDVFRIDLNDMSEEILLLPGDEIHLPRTFLAQIVAYVREYIFGLIPGGIWSGFSFF